MSDARYARVRDVFHRVCELPANQRAAEVSSLCAGDAALKSEVERLLTAMDHASAPTSGLSDPGWTHAAQPTVHGFRILRPIGEGGMGTVYEAEQDRPRRRVALKVIRSAFVSDAIRRRFQREAEVLARLQHPGISQIYETGVGDVGGHSVPYFAMELVEGLPLHAYAKEKPLDLRAKLALATHLCDAVAHAHERGVVHRDLKPANILVTPDGHPKILDFGIARLTDQDLSVTTMRTEAGQILGTAAYMSPEQASGDPADIDARTDVYALGVVIFELLAGRLPHDVERLPLPDAIRVIREEEPTRLGSIHAHLKGDIETILSKALERDRHARYQSAAELGAEIRRFLSDEPIIARPPSTIYQLRKFARRHKVLVGATAAVVLALVAGLLAVSLALRQESRQRAKAEEALAHAGASAAFLEDVLLGMEPRQAGDLDTALLQKMLERASTRLEAQVPFPLVRADMLTTIGRTYQAIYEFEKSVLILSQAVDLYTQTNPADQSMWNEAQLVLSKALTQTGKPDDAERALLAVLDRVRTREDIHHHEMALRQLAELQIDRGDWNEGLTTIDLAATFADRVAPIERGKIAMLRGAALRRLRRFDEANESYTSAHDIYRDANAPFEQSMALNSLAVLARDLGRPADAERLYRESIALREQVDSRPNPEVAAALANLGRLLVAQGRFDEARPILERSIPMHKSVYGPEHSSVALPTFSLAEMLSKQGDHDQALTLSAEGLRLVRASLPPKHVFVVRGFSEHGSNLLRAGRFTDAEAMLRDALAAADGSPADHRTIVVPIERDLATAIARQGRQAEAAQRLGDLVRRNDLAPEVRRQFEALLVEWANVASQAGPGSTVDQSLDENRATGDQH